MRDATGFRTEDLRLANPQLSFASNGRVSSSQTDIGFEARLADLAALDPRLCGALTATGQAIGDGRPIRVEVAARVASGSVDGHALSNLALGFTGEVDGADVTGSLDGSGGFDGLVLDLAGDIARTGDRQSIDGLVVAVGPNRLTGSLARTGDAPATGRLTLDAPDIAPVAALALVEATGALGADITLDAAEVGQGVTVDASARGLGFGATAVGALDANARITDALGLPMLQGTLTAADATVGGIGIASLTAEAEQVDRDSMRFTASSRLAIGTLADASGELTRLDGGFAATLASLSLRQPGMAATLTAPATVTVQRRRDRADAAGARLRHRQPDRAGADRRGDRRRRRDPGDAAGARQQPSGPISASPAPSTAARGSPGRATPPERAVRPDRHRSGDARSPAMPGCRRSRCRRAARRPTGG